MTTVLEIIRDAYRESNLIALGDVPSADQLDEGLTLLKRYRLSVYGTEAGEQLDPMPIGRHNIQRPQGYPWYDQVPDNTNWFVPANVRLYLNLEFAQIVYLSPNPMDGTRFAFRDESDNLSTYNFTVRGNGRQIDDQTELTFSTDGDAREYFYRSDLSGWKVIDPLTPYDDWPFPEEFDDMFVIGLAMRLNPRNVIQTAPESVAAYKRLLLMFEARYRQSCEVGSELALLRTPGTKYRYYADGTFADAAFKSGYAYPPGYRGWR